MNLLYLKIDKKQRTLNKKNKKNNSFMKKSYL